MNLREYFRDVLFRIQTGADLTMLTPHAWREHFEAQVWAHRDEVLNRFFEERDDR